MQEYVIENDVNITRENLAKIKALKIKLYITLNEFGYRFCKPKTKIYDDHMTQQVCDNKDERALEQIH